FLEPISKIPMRGNGSDFVSYRGVSTTAWPKPRRGEATKRGDKSAPPRGVARNRHPHGVERLERSFGYALRLSPCDRTDCEPFPHMGIFEMGSILEKKESIMILTLFKRGHCE
ncbi:hypothetical protein, partial [Hydrogenimonas sp.]